jgi:hypothetical protein
MGKLVKAVNILTSNEVVTCSNAGQETDYIKEFRRFISSVPPGKLYNNISN